MYQKYFKRLLDIILSLILLIFFLPFMILIFFLIWFVIGFPIFTQRRPGMNNKILEFINSKLYMIFQEYFRKKKQNALGNF